MGLLIEGVWHDQWYNTQKTGGNFIRQDSTFRSVLGSENFPIEKNRYHLYLSYACPWAHRTAIVCKLKDLDELVSISYVNPIMLENGWELDPSDSGPLKQARYLHEVYTKADPKYSGRVTVPVLWDTHTHQIVNNESSEIIRILNTAFDALTGNKLDLYPEKLRPQIDAFNEEIYHQINNGVYKVGFATEQKVYEQELKALFDCLEKLDQHLSRQHYLVGNTLTEADIRLFTTLVRFDAVYFGHFKCNIKQLKDFEYLYRFTKQLYDKAEVKETLNMQHIKEHYYISHITINPTQIVAKGSSYEFK